MGVKGLGLGMGLGFRVNLHTAPTEQQFDNVYPKILCSLLLLHKNSKL